MKSNHLNHAQVFKAFCDENRLMILEMLHSGEKCACILLEKLEISQPTLSHHTKILFMNQMQEKIIPAFGGKF